MCSKLTDLEKELVAKLRSKVRDILQTEEQREDTYLVRWLRARQLDLQKGEDMLRKSLEWRRENNVDGILDREDVPEKYKKLYPTGICGVDTEGCPIILLPLGRYNHKIFIQAEGLPQALRYNIIWVERMMKILREEEARRGTKGIRLIQVVDMEFYSYKEMVYRPGIEFLTQTQKIFDENYPEMLKYLMVINAPKVFAMLFALVKPLMSKETLSKIDIYGPEEEVWKGVMRKRFPLERIPKRWGGLLEGSDPFCSQSDVWLDTTIPLTYFTREDESLEGFTHVKVGAREKLKVEVAVEEGKSAELHWCFKTLDHDIGFQILGPKKEVLIPLARLDSQNEVKEGQLNCAVKGTYLIIFDNSYSYTKSKTLYYTLNVLCNEGLKPKIDK